MKGIFISFFLLFLFLSGCSSSTMDLNKSIDTIESLQEESDEKFYALMDEFTQGKISGEAFASAVHEQTTPYINKIDTHTKELLALEEVQKDEVLNGYLHQLPALQELHIEDLRKAVIYNPHISIEEVKEINKKRTAALF